MDALIVLLGTAIVSKDIDSLIYGMIISFLLSTVVDKVMYGIDAGKMTLIVTDYAKEVAEKIDEVTARGATFLKMCIRDSFNCFHWKSISQRS